MGSVIGMFKKLVGSTSSIMKVLGGALLLVGGVAVVAISKANDTENFIEGTTTLELPEDDVDVIDITENVEVEETVTE